MTLRSVPLSVRAALGLWVGVLASGCGRDAGQRAFDEGMVALSRGEWVQAQTALEKSIARRPGHPDNAAAYNALGVALAQLGQPGLAEEKFGQARRIDPTAAAAAHNHGLVRLQMGETDHAIHALEVASRLEPEDADALLALVHSRIPRNPVAALAAAQEAVNRQPDRPETWNALGVVFWRQGNANQARTSFERALVAGPDYPEAVWNLARLSEVEIRVDRAVAGYVRFLELRPAGVAADRARSALARLDPSGAGQAFRDLVPPPPPDPVAALLIQARALRQRGEPAEAFARYMEATEAATSPARKLAVVEEVAREFFDSPRAQLVLARARLDAGLAEEALRAGQQAIVLNPRWSAPHLLVAPLALRLRQVDAAVASYRALTEITPEDREAWWSLATLYRDTVQAAQPAEDAFREFADRFPQDRRAQDARRLVAQYVRDRESRAPTPSPTPRPTPVLPDPPSRPRLGGEPVPARSIPFSPTMARDAGAAIQLYNRAIEYQNRGQNDDARTFYLRALEQDDRLVPAYYNVGNLYQAAGDLERAMDAYQRALAVDPAHHQAAFSLAVIYLNRNLLDLARARLERVVSDVPSHARAHFALGNVLARQNQVSEAARVYRVFLRLAPDDPSAARVRTWLEGHGL